MNTVDRLKRQIDTVLPYKEINTDVLLDQLRKEVNLHRLVENVEGWARENEIHTANPDKQLLKLVEETGEVAQAYTRKDYEELKKEIGDVVVVLINFVMQNHMTLEGCLSAAYTKIANRKGEMRDGVFVKESDLSES